MLPIPLPQSGDNRLRWAAWEGGGGTPELCSPAFADGSDEPQNLGSQPGPPWSYQLTMAWHVSALLPALLPAGFPPPQDPSSPHSVHSYSSRENGVEKVPLGRKEAVPLSPTSMASSSSTSPSRSKDAPTVCVVPGAPWALCLGCAPHCPRSAARAAGHGSTCLQTTGHRQCWGARGSSCSVRSPLASCPPDPVAQAGLSLGVRKRDLGST